MEVKEVHYIDVKKKRIHFSPRIYFVIGQKQSKMFHNCNSSMCGPMLLLCKTDIAVYKRDSSHKNENCHNLLTLISFQT